MDIALLQMSQARMQPVKQNDQVQAAESSNENSFDKVFNETVNRQSVQQNEGTESTVVVENVPAEVVAVEVAEVVEVESLQELFDVLGIEYDESMLFVELNGELVAVDQLLNLGDISELLGMSTEQLQQMIQQLTDGEVQVTDIWSLLEQAPEVLVHVMATLAGEANAVTPKEAGQVVNILKLATMLGQKTDTVYSQEVKLADTKSSLQLFVVQLQQVIQKMEQPKAQTSPIVQITQAATSFGKAVEQATQTQTKSETAPNDSQQVASVQSQQNTAPTRTVTVTLPMERPQQSEALIKEIQNLLNRSLLTNNGGTIKLMLKLFPENLGQIRIEIMQQDGVMQARLLATTAAGKELLDSNLNQLKNAFVAHNIQMERIDVAQSLQNTNQNLRDQGFFNQFFRQQQEDEEEKKEDKESISFEDLLEEQIQAEEV